MNDNHTPNTLIREVIQEAGAEMAARSGLPETAGILELLSATDEQGQTRHFYFLVKPSRYVEYKYNVANGIPFEMDDFGAVLEQGDGPLPSIEQQDRMKMLAGIDPGAMAGNQALIDAEIQKFKDSLEGQ